MSLSCLNTNDEIQDIEWLYIKGGWVPAITVCLDNLYTSIPIDEGISVSYSVMHIDIVDNAASISPSFGRTVGWVYECD